MIGRELDVIPCEKSSKWIGVGRWLDWPLGESINDGWFDSLVARFWNRKVLLKNIVALFTSDCLLLRSAMQFAECEIEVSPWRDVLLNQLQPLLILYSLDDCLLFEPIPDSNSCRADCWCPLFLPIFSKDCNKAEVKPLGNASLMTTSEPLTRQRRQPLHYLYVRETS